MSDHIDRVKIGWEGGINYPRLGCGDVHGCVQVWGREQGERLGSVGSLHRLCVCPQWEVQKGRAYACNS